jgi:hypothetical protein
MFALSDSQLRTIWNAADGLPAEKRGIYLERMIAWLQFRGGRFIDRDLDDAVRLALRGLIHESAGSQRASLSRGHTDSTLRGFSDSRASLPADLDLNQIAKSRDLFSWCAWGGSGVSNLWRTI